MKLNVLLALTDQLRSKYKNMVSDFTKFFENSQSAFLGEKNTYIPREGAIDDSSKRKHTKVVTTVDEKFDWFIKESEQFVDALFSQEKTNATGVAAAELIVDGKSWGKFTSLELLRLKSLLENSDLESLEKMLKQIPVRSESIVWEPTTNEEYRNRKIFETPQVSGISRTTEKIEYVLEDPNLKYGVPGNYSPKTSVKTIPIEIGDYTTQKFSGEWSHYERAMTLKRRNDLITAVVVALKVCNDVEQVSSELTAKKIFKYLFYGENKEI